MVVGAVPAKPTSGCDRAAPEAPAHVAGNVAALLAKRLAIAVSPIGLLMTIPTAQSGSCLTIKMTERSKCGSPIEGAATSSRPANDGRVRRFIRIRGRSAVCKTYAKITPRRRHPIADIARSRP